MAKPKGKLEAAVKRVVKRVLDTWGAYQFWPVQTGLGKHTLDCIACVPVRITQDLVGKTVGVFVSVETKREDISTPTAKQGECMREMRSAGGVSILVNSVSDIDVEDQIVWAIKHGPQVSDKWINISSPYTRGE